MHDAETVLIALKNAKEYLELIRNLHSTGGLIPTAPEWVNREFFEFIDSAEWRCDCAIGLLERSPQWGGAGGNEPDSGNIH
jgi:hypothetical protein